MAIKVGDNVSVDKDKEPKWLSTRPIKVIEIKGENAICSYECWDNDPKGNTRPSNAIWTKGTFLLIDLTVI